MSSWLDIAIGVAGVWFLLAVFVSAINELIVRILALRSKQLWAALAQILDGERGRPVLANLVHLPFEQARPKDPEPGQDATQVERLYATAAVQALENRPDAGTSTRIGHLPAPVFAQSVVEMATKASATGESIDDWVASLPDTSPIKHGLKALLVTSQGDLNKFRDGVERVFDAQMARVSAIYRAQVRVITLGLAVVVGLGAFGAGMRVDALRLVSDLQRNQNLSAAYASAGSTLSSTDLAGLAAAGCPSGSRRGHPGDGWRRGPGRLRLRGRGVRPRPGAQPGLHAAVRRQRRHPR